MFKIEIGQKAGVCIGSDRYQEKVLNVTEKRISVSNFNRSPKLFYRKIYTKLDGTEGVVYKNKNYQLNFNSVETVLDKNF